MSDAKLLRSLIRAGIEGDSDTFKAASDAVIREESEKNHHLLGNDLEGSLYGERPRTSRGEPRLLPDKGLPITKDSGLALAEERPTATRYIRRGNNRWLSREARTLQMSRWTFKRRPCGQLFVVVTRQDAPWSTVNDDLEPFALCVSIADRANIQSRLYAQVQALLRAWVEHRARVRVSRNRMDRMFL